MFTRRQSLQAMASLSGACMLPTLSHAATMPGPSASRWHMPDEAEPHQRTWMAFGPNLDIWGEDLLPEVRRNLATIAQAIARFEPVSMLVRPEEKALARNLMGSDIELIATPLDDLWIRDCGPVFVTRANGKKAGIDFNFNGWGEKQPFEQDARVSQFVSAHAGVERLTTSLVLEGGSIEVDGHGTAIITESCVLNANRNPGFTKAQCEVLLKPLLGLKKILWLPGIAGRDITDGHTDFYARFAKSGTVAAAYDPDPASYDHAITKRHLDMLKGMTDAEGRSLEVVVLEGPTDIRPRYANNDFAAGYLNFYVCNGGVIAPSFGDARTDSEAHDKLQTLFPGHEIVQIPIDGVAAGGGGIHCTTQQEPRA